jgi:hypothetical protein
MFINPILILFVVSLCICAALFVLGILYHDVCKEYDKFKKEFEQTRQYYEKVIGYQRERLENAENT